MDDVRRIPVTGIKCSKCGSLMQLVWIRRLEEVARELSIGYSEKEGITHLWGSNPIAREVCEDLGVEENSDRLRCPCCGNEITSFEEYLGAHPHLLCTDQGPLFTEPDSDGNYTRIDYREKELLEEKKNYEEVVEEKDETIVNAAQMEPDTKILVGIKCSKCGNKMRHTQISRVVDNNTELRLFSYSEGIVSDYEVEWLEYEDYVETEQDSDLLSCPYCGVEISGKKDIIDYINKHPDCLETEEIPL